MPRPQNLQLKVAIIADGRCQKDIAVQAMIEPPHLSHVIYGRRALSVREQGRLARVLGCPLHDLFPPTETRP
jgi:hypothetical protein